MGIIKTKDIKYSLQKKGFFEEIGDHLFYFYYIDDKKTEIYTKISHGEKEIDDFLISKMSKQLRLSKTQFIDLIRCSLSKEEYKEIVIQTLGL